MGRFTERSRLHARRLAAEKSYTSSDDDERSTPWLLMSCAAYLIKVKNRLQTCRLKVMMSWLKIEIRIREAPRRQPQGSMEKERNA